MERRLAAILLTDMVGYSRLMGLDEEGTIARQKADHEEVFDPKISAYGGRIVKSTGDGLLVEFSSVVDAVKCAADVQRELASRDVDVPDDRRIQYRIGINIGDIIVDGDDILGDGVNVAARLEGLAQPGSICISGIVYDQLAGKSDIEFADAGEQTVKNVPRPIRVWHWKTDQTARSLSAASEPSSLPDKPSVAVLPFANMSNDLDREYFADGLVEDLITALSRFHWLDVVARNSCFSFKGQSVPTSEVVEILGVGYVVEGSVRSSVTRLRVTAQLIDASKDRHIWAENYDRQPGDLFDLQDEITGTIVGVLVPALSAAERERSMRINRPKLGAWEVYQRALAHYYRPYSAEDNLEARRLFSLAIGQDPAFADAHAMLALMGVYAVHSGQSTYTEPREEILAQARRLAQQAVQLDDDNALGHTALGRVNDMLGNAENAIAECQAAVRLNPNFALAQFELGMVLSRAEHFEQAVEHMDEAIRLSPNDPARWNFYVIKGRALFSLGRYEEAVQMTKESSRLRPEAFFPALVMTSAQVELNRMADAAASVAYVLERRPDMTCGLLQKLFGNNIKGADILIDNCRKAGLPD